MKNDIDYDNINIEMDIKEKMIINKTKNKNNDKIYKQGYNNSSNSDSDDEGFKYNTYEFYDEKEKTNIYLQLINLVKTKNLLN